MHTNVRLWVKAICGPLAKLTNLLMCNRVSSITLMVKLESWGYFPSVNAGIVNFACLSPTLSEIVKPLSAMTISPGTKNSKKPQCSVRYLSEVLPPQASDTKEMFLRVSIYDSRGSTMAVNDGCQGLRSRGGKPRIGLPSGFSTKLSHVQWEIRQTRKRGATFFPPC